MTAEERDEGESEAIDYTRINVGIMCGTMRAPSIDTKTVFMRHRSEERLIAKIAL